MEVGVAGANESEFHVKNVVPGRDFSVECVGDFRNVKEDEACRLLNRIINEAEIINVFKVATDI